MASDDKFVGLMRLTNGDAPKDIASDLGISYATVLRWKGELTKAEEAGKINALLSLEQGLIQSIGSNVIADYPAEVQDIANEALGELVVKVEGLSRLESELQTTAMKINTRLRLMCSTAESIGDIVEITEAVCKLQAAFFGKGTVVNIQNNNVGDGTYGEYLNDGPGGT